MLDGYRNRIYAKYATDFQGATDKFDIGAAKTWGKAYNYYLRDWIPKESDAKILDVACGSGRLLHYFRSRGYTRVYGIDISPQQVGLARQVCPDVEEGDAIKLLEPRKQRYDLIVGLDVIEHFSKNEVLRFLDVCFDALRPGGRIILQTPNADSPFGATHRYGDFTHETCFNPSSLTQLLKVCGFNSVDSREMGPVPIGYSVRSSIRSLGWSFIRQGLKVWNSIETGGSGSGVFTRVFLVSAEKK